MNNEFLKNVERSRRGFLIEVPFGICLLRVRKTNGNLSQASRSLEFNGWISQDLFACTGFKILILASYLLM